MLKNVNFKKYILQQSPLNAVKPILQLAMETCNPETAYTDQSIEVYTNAFRFLLSLLCLPQVHPLGGGVSGHRKFYIPGETIDLEKMR